MGSLKIFSLRSNRILFVGKKIATNFPPLRFTIIPYPIEYTVRIQRTLVKQQKWALSSEWTYYLLLLENFSRSRRTG